MPKTKREPESDDDHAPEAAPGSAEVSESEDQLPAQKKQKQVPAKAASAPPASAKAGPSSALPEAKKDADGGTYYQLGEKKRLTVRTYKNTLLYDIREYYVDKNSGEEKPGKKGISLTEQQFLALAKISGDAIEVGKTM